jgi:hypothetical protein
MLIIIGPKDMLKTGYKFGMWVRKINAEFQSMARKVIDDEGIREQIHEIQGEALGLQKSYREVVNTINPLAQPVIDNKIAPVESPALKEIKKVKSSPRKPKTTAAKPKRSNKAPVS